MKRYESHSPLTPFRGHPAFRQSAPPREQFQNLNATSLYCPKCKAAMPVRERLLLILPDGELHEYRCARCGTSLGERKVSKKPEPFLVR